MSLEPFKGLSPFNEEDAEYLLRSGRRCPIRHEYAPGSPAHDSPWRGRRRQNVVSQGRCRPCHEPGGEA